MRKNNGYMIPKTKQRKTPKTYTCNRCGKVLKPSEAFFYIDECNCAITDNALPFCRECYDIAHPKWYGKKCEK